MNIMSKLFITLNCCLMLAFPALAQNIKQDMLAINKACHQQNNVSVGFSYTLYKDDKSKEAIDVVQGEIKRLGENLHYKLADMEIIRNEKYNLIIDHQSKLISLSEHNTRLFDWNEGLYFGNFEQYMKLYEKSTFSSQGNTATYDLQLKTGQFARIQITYNKQNYLMTKVVLYYREAQDISRDQRGEKTKPRLEINYTSTDVKAKLEAENFSELNYLDKNGKNYSCKAAYKTYRLQVNIF